MTTKVFILIQIVKAVPKVWRIKFLACSGIITNLLYTNIMKSIKPFVRKIKFWINSLYTVYT